MATFARDLGVLLDQMEWDSAEGVVGRLNRVVREHHLDKECPACGAAKGQMCLTPKRHQDRTVIHEERRLAS